MKRLTKTYSNDSVTINAEGFPQFQETIDSEVRNSEAVLAAVTRLKEYEDAEESRLMVRLPCKVGDTVYSYSKEFGAVLAYFVEQIVILYDTDNKNGLWIYNANCDETGELLDSIDFYEKDLDKTVFLTRKEAEQALKGSVDK